LRIQTETISVSTKGYTDIIDLTDELNRRLAETGMRSGTVTLFIGGSTAGLSTIEYEPGLLKDLPEMFDQVAPYEKDYAHHQTWGDRNGAAHCRAPLIGPSLVIPFVNRRFTLGTWQQVVLFDFDDRGRQREVVCQFQGE